MKKEEFIETVKGLVFVYINNADGYGKDAQISVNPVTLFVDLDTANEFHQALADSEEVIENAAYAFGGRDEEYTDFQATENPEFYPVRTLIKTADDKEIPDDEAIRRLADNYFS